MAKPFDYSKWDNIELSDDESDLHPNIDKDSWFRMKHRARLEREEKEDQEKAEINRLNTDAQRRIRELKARIDRVKNAGDDDDDVVDDEEALTAEVEQLEAEVDKRNKRVEQIDKARAWNIDNICHVKDEKTILNSATASSSLAAHDYAPQGHWTPEEENETKTETPATGKAATTAAAPAAAAPAATSAKPAASASSGSSASKPTQPKKPITDHDEIISYNDFVIGNEQTLETYCELPDLEKSKEYLFRNGHILLHEHGQAYILLSCLEDEMNGKHDRARHVCRQSQLLTHVTELAQSMHRDPRDMVLAFFRRIEEPEYRQVFETSVAEFVERIKKRAVQKRLEMAKDDNPLGPGQLDPQEVFNSLPESIQTAFETQNIPALQQALAAMGKKQAHYHMRRCVKAGLWVPENPHEFDSDSEDEEAEDSKQA